MTNPVAGALLKWQEHGVLKPNAFGLHGFHWFTVCAPAGWESQRVAAFVQRLRELGWVERRNLAIEYRWAEGRNDRFAEIAASCQERT